MTEHTQARAESAGREARQAFTGLHLRGVTLTAAESRKRTVHHEISLSGSNVSYLPGDALGVYPSNDPGLVARILERLGVRDTDIVSGPRGETHTFAEALGDRYTLASPSRRLLELFATRGATDLAALLRPENTSQLKQYLTGPNGHDVLDVLEAYPEIKVDPVEFVSTLRSLLPRLYSIASSQRAHPDQVHLLVVSASSTLRDRPRPGVASTWLNDRWPVGATAEMYLQNQQKHFAMPADPATPLIMVGPGTGVAPFRAFLEERRMLGASGPNWLFFGEQHRASEFFYEDQFTAYALDGFLRLDTAFSRDQASKIYVQHRLEEHGRDVWDWLEHGAALYVCGDKERMAADVERALHHIVESVGGKTPEQAREYVDALKTTKRYQKDVY